MTDIVDAVYENVHVLLGPEQGKRMAAFIKAREDAARREGIKEAAKVASNWNIPSVDKPAAIRVLLEDGR